MKVTVEYEHKRPQLKDSFKNLSFIGVLEEYMDFLEFDSYQEDNDYKHFIYEEVLEAAYGKEVWKFISERQDAPRPLSSPPVVGKLHVGTTPHTAMCRLFPQREAFNTDGIEDCPYCKKMLTT